MMKPGRNADVFAFFVLLRSVALVLIANCEMKVVFEQKVSAAKEIVLVHYGLTRILLSD
jgi:hypothetical protein